MKKIAILIVLLFGLMLTSCTNQKDDTPIDPNPGDKEPAEKYPDDNDDEPNEELPVDNPKDFSKSIKILAIGNSFSDDALEYFWEIATDYGIEEVVIGILYKAGARLEQHWDSITTNTADYVYRKKTTGKWVNRNNSSIEYGIKDEEWDIITLQQSSGYSGLEASYQPYLNHMVNYVKQHATHDDYQIYWHLTWAYQGNYSATNAFEWYDKDQMKMYKGILESVKKHVMTHEDIELVIPAGTTIQNARTSYLGDTLTRDGYHLTYDVGRFGVALTWFHKITGFPLEAINYTPAGVSQLDKLMLIDAAYKAIRTPFRVTESDYKERVPSLNDFNKLNINFDLGYWSESSDTLIKDDSIAKYFVSSTTKVAKADLPVGSMIALKGNYKFKLTFFKTDGSKVITYFNYLTDIVITEDFWKDYTHVAISVAASDGIINLTDKLVETSANIGFYVPKK